MLMSPKGTINCTLKSVKGKRHHLEEEKCKIAAGILGASQKTILGFLLSSQLYFKYSFEIIKKIL